MWNNPAAYTFPHLQHLDVFNCIILTQLATQLWTATVTRRAKEQETAEPYEEVSKAMSETSLPSGDFIGRHHDQHATCYARTVSFSLPKLNAAVNTRDAPAATAPPSKRYGKTNPRIQPVKYETSDAPAATAPPSKRYGKTNPRIQPVKPETSFLLMPTATDHICEAPPAADTHLCEWQEVITPSSLDFTSRDTVGTLDTTAAAAHGANLCFPLMMLFNLWKLDSAAALEHSYVRLIGAWLLNMM